MKTCKKCGEKSRDDAKFCLNCGEPFTTAKTKKATTSKTKAVKSTTTKSTSKTTKSSTASKTKKTATATKTTGAKKTTTATRAKKATSPKKTTKSAASTKSTSTKKSTVAKPRKTTTTATRKTRGNSTAQQLVPVDETTVVVDGKNVIKSLDNIAFRKVLNKKKLLIIAICIVAIIIGTVIGLIVHNNIVQQKRKEAASEFISVANEFYKLADEDFTENMKKMNKCNKVMISYYDELIYRDDVWGGKWRAKYDDGCIIFAYDWIKMRNHWKSHIYGSDFKRCKDNQTKIAGFLDELNTFYEKIEINVNGDLSGASETIVNIKKAITDLNTNYSAYYKFLLDVEDDTEYEDYKNEATRFTRSISKSLEKLNTYLNNIDTDIKGMEL